MKVKIIPPPLGIGEECILLSLGISRNFEDDIDMNFLNSMLLTKKENINIIG